MTTFKTTALALLTTAMVTPLSAQTLDLAWSQDATGLDPHTQPGFATIRLLELMYEPLVRLDANLELQPAVAESWAFSDDGLQLTFQLDPDAMFHDGTPVTSADVAASFTRILDEETGAIARANYTSIIEIQTPDDHTVTFVLDGADAPILNGMASVNAAVVPASAIEAGTIATEVVGSGPFTLESRTPNASANLVAFDGWHGGDVAYDNIAISVLPDETALLAALRAGQADFALINDPLVATLIPQSPGLSLNTAPTLSYYVLQLNAAREPMDSLPLRQAISCAIDRQDILDAALLGEGEVTGPLTSPAYRTDPSGLFCYEQDQDRARELLAEAGYADGFTATVMAATGEPPTASSVAQVIQSQLAEVGIELEIEMQELSVYIDRWLAADFDMAVALNGGRVDPYTMYNRYWTRDGNLQGVANYIDDTLDSLMNEGRTETDPARRSEIFAEFEGHLADMSPWVWLFTGNTYTAQVEGVSGFEASPTGSLFGLVDVTLAE
ncbi:ABC transporter substrate-binding protein [Rhodobacteraceae bacterium N5(2021)]|uniref:ABC transporter substrate-binding protein n=1 Tax=Gymnodinialimonas phycosphaerae TaxID=2841589 RepID=A0A975YE96_9RHOB|nr:ABC transporter substrate-binding protein [Gymnodinialimonas phycosphaerae]MBY4893346.1 ABC transporter substrate-binding protein [Gymnodinialimonas phycosphaerae]